MAKDQPQPAEIGHKEAVGLVADATPESYEDNREFYDGDHWQEGDGWIGPRLQEGTAGATTALDEILKVFTSRNVVKEVVDRHRLAAGGKETRWHFTPVEEREDLDSIEEEGERERLQEQYDQEDAKIAELESQVTKWWDRQQIPKILGNAVVNLLLGERAPLRLYIPQGLMEETTGEDGEPSGEWIVPSGDFAETLNRIHVDAPDPSSAMLYEDPDTKAEAGIFLEEVGDTGDVVAHISLLDPEADTDPETILRVLQKGETAEGAEEFRVDLGGRLPIAEMRRHPFVTDQVRQQQRSLNLAYTMIPRNVITSGFLERIFLNTQLPGHFEQADDGTEKFVPDPFYVGPGTTNVLKGEEIVDAEGKARIATPDVKFREPTDPTPSEKAGRAHYQAILEEVDQVHILIAGDATASGVSREQARADFEASLRETMKELEAAVRWLLETTIVMTETLASGASPLGSDILEKYRAVAAPIIDLGPIDPESRKAAMEEVDAGLRSREGAMETIGVEDVDAELARIERQEDTVLTFRQRAQEVVLEYVREGVSFYDAAKLAGITDPGLLGIYAKIDAQTEGVTREEEAQDGEIDEALRGTTIEGGEEPPPTEEGGAEGGEDLATELQGAAAG